MIRVEIPAGFLDVANTKLRIVRNNPFFITDVTEGTFTYPIVFPPTSNNKRKFGFLDLLYSPTPFALIDGARLYDGDTHHLSGMLKITHASPNYGYKGYIIAEQGLIADKIKNTFLSDINLGGTRTIDFTGGALPAMNNFMLAAANGNISSHDFTYFPVLNEGFWEDIDPGGTGDNTMYIKGQNYYRHNPSADYPFFPDLGSGEVTKHWPVTPFPYTIYLLHRIFEHAGFVLNGSFVNDAEIKTLVNYTNHFINYTTINNTPSAFENTFNLRDFVPTITLSQFLNDIKNLFCLGINFNNDFKTATITPFKDLGPSQDIEDWSNILNYLDTEDLSKKGGKFSFALDSNDNFASNLKELESKYDIQPSVMNQADLPVNPTIDQARYVIKENWWYVSVQTGVFPLSTTGWTPYSENIFPLRFPTEELELETGISPLSQLHALTDNQFYTTSPLNVWTIPATHMKGVSKSQYHIFIAFLNAMNENSSTTNRMMFYRGFQSYLSPYPFASKREYDPTYTNPIANYSLLWDGESGLYKKWWDLYYNTIILGKKAEFEGRLTASRLTNHSFLRKKNYWGTLFIDKTIDYQIPMASSPPAKISMMKMKQ